MQDLERIISKFEEIVSPNFCNELAKKTGFIQRSTSKIQGHEFAKALMIPNAFIEGETLNSLALRMQKINKECNLSAPALAQRINTKKAVAFMKGSFAKVLKEVIQKEFNNLPDLKNIGGFNRILIEDSTLVELHEKLSPYFKGFGGAASGAALKIDFIFDYLSEQFVDIEFFSANKPDQSLASRIITMLEKYDLVIRDLGYFVLKSIKDIEKAEAYYISRLKSNVDVYMSKEAQEPLDLAVFLDKESFCGLIDIEVFIGKERHPVRLVACQMSEDAINKRRRDANRTAQRCRRQISTKKMNLLKYSIFITNVPVEILSSTHVMAIYRSRWRIELIFKQWKSCLKLHIFKGYNKERIYCLLYGRLIMVLLLGSIAPILMRYAMDLGRELSCFKLTNYLIADHSFTIALLEGKIDQFINKLLQDIPRRLCQDKRKRLSMRNNVRMGNSYYKKLMNNNLNKEAA
jgi:Transposase DDE domain